jgi:hypothetical protein
VSTEANQAIDRLEVDTIAVGKVERVKPADQLFIAAIACGELGNDQGDGRGSVIFYDGTLKARAFLKFWLE